MSVDLERCYRLAKKTRLRWDATRGEPLLLYPERGLKLNAVAFAILRGCDGTARMSAVLEGVAGEFSVTLDRVREDATPFLSELLRRGLLVEVEP